MAHDRSGFVQRCLEVSMGGEVTSRHLPPDLPKRGEVGRSPPLGGAYVTSQGSPALEVRGGEVSSIISGLCFGRALVPSCFGWRFAERERWALGEAGWLRRGRLDQAHVRSSPDPVKPPRLHGAMTDPLVHLDPLAVPGRWHVDATDDEGTGQ